MQAFLSFFQNNLVVQIIGFVGMAISLVAIQCKSYNRLTLLRVCSQFTFGVQYLLAGAWTGMATNFAAVCTNSVYRYRIKRKKGTLPFQIVFAFLYIALGILSWHGRICLLIIIASVLSTVAMGIKQTRVIRIFNLCSYPMWLIYNIHAGLIGAIATDCVTIISLLLAILRIDILPALRKKREAARVQTND